MFSLQRQVCIDVIFLCIYKFLEYSRKNINYKISRSINYAQFLEFYFAFAVNRRLDEWVKLHQLDLDSVENDVDEKVEDKVYKPYCFRI